MIELVFVACLAIQHDRCEQHSLLFAEVSMLTCMTQGQPHLAQWREIHPKWEIRRWSCRPHDASRVEI